MEVISRIHAHFFRVISDIKYHYLFKYFFPSYVLFSAKFLNAKGREVTMSEKCYVFIDCHLKCQNTVLTHLIVSLYFHKCHCWSTTGPLIPLMTLDRVRVKVFVGMSSEHSENWYTFFIGNDIFRLKLIICHYLFDFSNL